MNDNFMHIEALLHCKQCLECYEEMRRYILTENGRVAGSVSTPKKASSSQINGLKGGRPRKNKAS